MYSSSSRGLSVGYALVAAFAGVACCGAQAAPPGDQTLPRVEAWSGAEAFHDIWSIYAGASWAPFGGVQQNGLRLRGVVGYGDYGSGAVEFADLLIGYHWQLGPLTLKVLGGMTVTDHRPDDPAGLAGTRFGGKGALEAWWNITDQAWAAADLSWGSAHMDHAARVRLGWRLWPELSAGLEGGSAGTWERDRASIGGFVRYEWVSGEIYVSGGVAFAGAGGRWDDETGPFGSVSLLTRF